MSVLSPKNKLEEIADFFASESIKFDLKPFGDGSRLISKYRKSMNELMQSDPYTAYMGLGALSVYENNYSIALNYFEAAEKLNSLVRSPKINISTTALLSGDLTKCIDTIINALYSFPDDAIVIGVALRILSMFFYYDEIDELNGKFINNTIFKEIFAKEQEDALDTREFIKAEKIDVNVLRSMQVIANQEFFSSFSVNSSFLSNYHVDMDDAKIDEIIYISKDLFKDSHVDMDIKIQEMNESLQEKYVDLMMYYLNQSDKKQLLESFRNISIYFSLDTRMKKS